MTKTSSTREQELPDFLPRPHIVFVSHTGYDHASVQELLLPELRSSFWDYHCENSRTRGSSAVSRLYEKSILRSLSRCGAMALVWSRHAAQSEWVMFEVHSAEQMRKPIFVLRIEESPNAPTANATVACFDGPGLQQLVAWLNALRQR